jgi:tetratricopeptide (TPR) repeat protein
MPMMSLKDAFDQAKGMHDRGYYRQALRQAEVLYKQTPFHPPVVALYVSCLTRVQQNELAARIAKRALRYITNKPHRVMILTQMCDGMTQSGEMDEAIKLVGAERDDQPDNLSLASAMCHMLMMRDDGDEALRVIHSLRERGLESLNLAAIKGRALLRTDRRDEAIDYIRGVIERLPNESPSSRGLAYNSLGHLLDKAKRYDEAMEAFHQGNKLTKPVFDEARLTNTLECVQRCWTPERFANAPQRPEASSPRPVFIVGMPRSGTTLTEQIIDAHPRGFGAGELGMIIDLFREVGIDPENPYDTGPDQVDADKLARVASEYRSYTRELAGERDVDVIVDKAPLNCLCLGFIALAFPDAKIIHCHRDPRDNCLSCYFQLLNAGHSYSFDLHSCGVYYRYYRGMMKQYRELLDSPQVDMAMFENDYEGMVADQEQRTRDILEYIGLPFDPACLEFHSSGRVAVTLSNDQVRQPIYTSSTKRYERYQDHLGPLIEGLGDVLDAESA